MPPMEHAEQLPTFIRAEQDVRMGANLASPLLSSYWAALLAVLTNFARDKNERHSSNQAIGDAFDAKERPERLRCSV